MINDITWLLLGIGLLGGAWNAVAGGATLVTFPALMAIGLPPVVANATNFVGLLPSNAAALPAYRHELGILGRRVWPLLAVCGLGAVCGSTLLTVSDPDLFVLLIPFLILFATALFAYGDACRRGLLRWVGARAAPGVVWGALFVASVYGGYFGAGLGVILLGLAQLLGMSSFHTANAFKNLLATGFTLLSIAVFGIGGMIAWSEAGLMVLGSTIGGYAGGRCAHYVNELWLRRAVTVFGVCLGVGYLLKNASAWPVWAA